MNQFGIEVKAARSKKGLTLDRLGRKVGSHKGYMSGIINDKVSPPSPRVVKRIAKVLELDYVRMLALSVIAKLPKDLDVKALRKICDEILDAKEREILDAHTAEHARQMQESAHAAAV